MGGKGDLILRFIKGKDPRISKLILNDNNKVVEFIKIGYYIKTHYKKQ